jgi:hypothetical protein
MDVYAGLVTAVLVAIASAKVAPACDRWWAKMIAAPSPFG